MPFTSVNRPDLSKQEIKMNIAIIGASGKAGNLIMKEALSRGHKVTAIVRNAYKLKQNVDVIEEDVMDLTREQLAPFDAVIDAFGSAPGSEEMHQTTLSHLSDILAGQKTRLLVVGGAASLYVDDALTTRLLDTPDFPDAYKPIAVNMSKAYEKLKKRSDVNWTYLSPSAFFNAVGARTGAYNVGKDKLLVNGHGDSTISYADFAIAMIDELETPRHIKQRFTVVEK
jgi:putative NADH-flavin reductase